MAQDGQEIQLPEGTIRYREAGSGPAIVFVHGYLVDHRLWDGVVDALKPGGPDFILVNYANPDMVGHTGKLNPAVSALETIDACVGRIVTAAAAAKAAVFITADHGNCETMIDPETGQPHTAHTTNPIPFIAIADDLIGRKLRTGGRLADVAPTLLFLLGLPQPKEMTGHNLLVPG